MSYIFRQIETKIDKALNRGKSILLIGPRQTGKTTMLSHRPADRVISFLQTRERQKYERDPQLLADEIGFQKRDTEQPKPPLVIIDEIQKVPAILDIVQYLIDQNKAQFVLTGSSARKLRRHGVINLLPGRVILFHMDPFVLSEYPQRPELDSLLAYGDLPGMVQWPEFESKEEELISYVSTYLEEEIRAEAAVRQVNLFSQFLELAAIESGKLINFSNISQELGVSSNTIKTYFEILEDCLITEKVQPLTKSNSRKSLTKACKYLFFDLGIRRVAAREGAILSRDKKGFLLEHWVGLELLRNLRLNFPQAKLRFWRDHNGPEVDWVIEKEDTYIPIEVKSTHRPTIRDCRHLNTFLNEYPNSKKGYIVCQVDRPLRLEERIDAIPWHQMNQILDLLSGRDQNCIERQ